MVKTVVVCDLVFLYAIDSGRAVVLHGDPVMLFYVIVYILLEGHDGRVFRRDVVGSPHVSGHNPVERPSEVLDGSEAGEAILSIAQ